MAHFRLGFLSSTLLTILGLLINAVFIGIFIADPALGWWGTTCCPTSAARMALDLFHTAILLTAFTLPLFMALMAALHLRASADKQGWTLLGLAFLSIFTALNGSVYYIQLTAVRTALLSGTAHDLAPFIYQNTNSPIFAIDLLGLFFFGLGTLAVIPALGGTRLERWIAGLFALNSLINALGLYAHATGNAPLLLYGVTPIGNTVPFIATALAALFFRRLRPATGGI